MAPRPNTSAASSADPAALPLKADDGAELVTYVPGEGDPSQVKWRGYAFRANVPKPINKPDHVAAARDNPFFHVGPFDPAKHGQPTVVKAAAVTDGRSYRAHVVAWLKTVETAEQLVQRWAADQRLRDLCEDIGTDDYLWLGTLIGPRLAQLIAFDDVPADRANDYETKLWQRYGVTVVPWRTAEGAQI